MITTQSDLEYFGSLFLLVLIFLACVLWVWAAYMESK